MPIITIELNAKESVKVDGTINFIEEYAFLLKIVMVEVIN